MTSKRTWFWVSRNDDDSNSINIHIRAQKPKRDSDCPKNWDIFFTPGSYTEGDLEVCRKYFEQFTGIKLKPGERKKIQLTAEVLE